MCKKLKKFQKKMTRHVDFNIIWSN